MEDLIDKEGEVVLRLVTSTESDPGDDGARVRSSAAVVTDKALYLKAGCFVRTLRLRWRM